MGLPRWTIASFLKPTGWEHTTAVGAESIRRVWNLHQQAVEEVSVFLEITTAVLICECELSVRRSAPRRRETRRPFSFAASRGTALPDVKFGHECPTPKLTPADEVLATFWAEQP